MSAHRRTLVLSDEDGAARTLAAAPPRHRPTAFGPFLRAHAWRANRDVRALAQHAAHLVEAGALSPFWSTAAELHAALWPQRGQVRMSTRRVAWFIAVAQECHHRHDLSRYAEDDHPATLRALGFPSSSFRPDKANQ